MTGRTFTFTDANDTVATAAAIAAANPDLAEQVQPPVRMRDPEGPDVFLSDLDNHYLTGAPIAELEYSSGYRRWVPLAEAERELGRSLS